MSNLPIDALFVRQSTPFGLRIKFEAQLDIVSDAFTMSTVDDGTNKNYSMI